MFQKIKNIFFTDNLSVIVISEILLIPKKFLLYLKNIFIKCECSRKEWSGRSNI